MNILKKHLKKFLSKNLHELAVHITFVASY